MSTKCCYECKVKMRTQDADIQGYHDGDLDRMFQKHKKDSAAAGAVHDPY